MAGSVDPQMSGDSIQCFSDHPLFLGLQPVEEKLLDQLGMLRSCRLQSSAARWQESGRQPAPVPLDGDSPDPATSLQAVGRVGELLG